MTALARRNVDMAAALKEAEDRFIAANPESRARHEAACRAMPGGNTRTVLHYSPFPLTLVRGAGARVWDADGHAYTDFQGEYSAGLYGHSEPRIEQAVSRALADGIVLGGPNRYEAALAEEIVRRFPSIELVRFCNSGTEANLMAISAASAVTGRKRILVFDGAYHGGVFYYAHGGAPTNAPFPTIVAPYNETRRAVEMVRHAGATLAAVIVEPMMGAGGCIPGTTEFLRALREVTTETGALLIFDEVMTSRLSPGGLQAPLGITPDLTTLGKYLGGGLSFGAFGGRAEIMARFDPRRGDAFPHAGTFNNNVLSMCAGLAGLTEVFTIEACRRLNEQGERLRARLNELGARRALPFQVSGIGSLMNVHFNAQAVRTPADAERDAGDALRLFHWDMLAAGQYLARRGYMALTLPMGEAELDGLVAAVDEFLASRGPLLAG